MTIARRSRSFLFWLGFAPMLFAVAMFVGADASPARAGEVLTAAVGDSPNSIVSGRLSIDPNWGVVPNYLSVSAYSLDTGALVDTYPETYAGAYYSGSFYELSLPPGRYSLVAGSYSRNRQTQTIDVISGQNAEVNFDLSCDVTPPVTTEINLSSTKWYSSPSSVTAQFNIADDLSGVYAINWALNGRSAGYQEFVGDPLSASLEQSLTVSLAYQVWAQGFNTLTYSSRDCGEYRTDPPSYSVETTKTKTILMDWIAPTATATTSSVPGTATVSLRATDGVSGVKSIAWRVDGGALQSVDSTRATVVLTNPGIHTVTYYSTDNAGLVSTTKQVKITVVERPGIEGFVRSAGSGAPIAGYVVALSGNGVNVEATTDIDGHYRFDYQPLYSTPMYYSVDARSNPDYSNESTSVVWAGTTRLLVDFSLTARKLAAYGFVRDAVTNEPISDATVHLAYCPPAQTTFHDIAYLVCDDDGKYVYYDWGRGAGIYRAYVLTPYGTHEAEIAPVNWNGVDPVSLDFSLEPTSPILAPDSCEPDDDRASAKTISTDGIVQRRTLSFAFDHDFVKFDADAGQTYTIEEYLGGLDTSHLDLVLLDADGNQLASGSTYGLTRFDWTAENSGPVYIDVYGQPTGYETGRYNLSVTSHAPAATDATTSILEGSPSEITLSGSDIDGDSLTYAIADRPAHGSLSAVSGNKVTYTPDVGYVGDDTFTFTAFDGKSVSATATVSISVLSGNHTPVANDGKAASSGGVRTPILLSAFDQDNDHLAYRIVSAPLHGSLEAVSGNRVIYVPTVGYTGGDRFTFQANDGAVDSAVATVSIDVVAANSSVTTTLAAGSGVAATARQVAVSFETVTGEGALEVTAFAPRHEAPGAFRLIPNLYFDIHPTASFSGVATVIMAIPADYAGDLTRLRVFHWKDNGWETITPVVDTEARTVTFETTSFSDYGLGEPTASEVVGTPATSTWSLVLAIAMILALLLRRLTLMQARGR